jgi:hypothetical protein
MEPTSVIYALTQTPHNDILLSNKPQAQEEFNLVQFFPLLPQLVLLVLDHKHHDTSVMTLKARNGEWVRARPDVSSTVLLWTRDIARPKGIATEKRFLCRRGESWTGLWSG